jgi:hypothetical protein
MELNLTSVLNVKIIYFFINFNVMRVGFVLIKHFLA